jgi:hypothetical protein
MTLVSYGGVRGAIAIAALVLSCGLIPQFVRAAPLISQGYYEDAAGKFCTSLTSCTASFTPVPVGKTLIVRNVSCSIAVFATSGVRVSQLLLTGNQRLTHINVPTPLANGGKTVFLFNEDLTKLLVGQQRPDVVIRVEQSTSMSMSCNLVGEIKG